MKRFSSYFRQACKSAKMDSITESDVEKMDSLIEEENVRKSNGDHSSIVTQDSAIDLLDDSTTDSMRTESSMKLGDDSLRTDIDDDEGLEKEYTAKRTKEQEEMVEIRRLRTENRLLRQRIDSLEQESSSLADRLIQGQVTRAQEAEETFTLKRELAVVKQQNIDLQIELDNANDKIKLLEEEVQKARERESKDAGELIQVLQEELVSVRLKEAETQVVVKDLRTKLAELEEANKKLRDTPPDNDVAKLQEQLIALKLREAETSLSMKELSQKIAEMNALWEKHLTESKEQNGRRKEYGKNTVAQLQEDLLSAKLKEASASAALKESNNKIMELESQIQVHLNQVKRQEEELNKVRDQVEASVVRERELLNTIRDEQRKGTDLESKMKEELMMARIREVERSQSIAELEQKLSSMECKHQELVTVRQLQRSDNEELREMQDRIADLQAEVMRLESLNKKLSVALGSVHNSPKKIPIAQMNGESHT